VTEFVISGKWGVAKKARRIPGNAGKRPKIRPGKGRTPGASRTIIMRTNLATVLDRPAAATMLES